MAMTSKMQYGMLSNITYMEILTLAFLHSSFGQIRSQSITYYPRMHELWVTRVATMGS